MQYQITDNQFLASLPGDAIERLSPAFEWVEFNAGQTIIHDPVTHIYFPLNGLASFVLMSESGGSSEIAIAGKEGLLGICVFLNSTTPIIPAIAQRSGQAIRVVAQAALQEFRRRDAFFITALSYIRVFFHQVAQTALCNAHHSLEQRFCRWLLLVADRLDEGEHVTMTQEAIASMLGVRREAVTRVAHQLKRRNLKDYGTRRIEVIDRQGLMRASCECYSVLRREYDQISGQ